MYCIEAPKVYDHDFQSYSEGVMIPHGIYDIQRNEGYINIGTSKDTSEFSCECLKDWWFNYGIKFYPYATSILVLADGGGSNSYRHYIFKEELQKVAINMGVEIRIAHYPSYASKYNPIEHRLFCHIQNSLNRNILISEEFTNSLIEKTTTTTGLKVFSTIKQKVFKTGKKVCDFFKNNMPIIFDEFLPKWNYRALPIIEWNIE